MQQRSSSCSSRAHGSGEHCVINVNQQQQQPVQVKQLCPLKKMDDMANLPVNHLHLDTKKMKKISLPWSAGKWVLHAIPVIVLLCFFLLWLFSYHVKLVKEDGIITAIHQIETPVPLNDTHIDVTILTVATSPITSVPLNLTSNNETEAHLVSTTDLRTILGDAAFSTMFA